MRTIADVIKEMVRIEEELDERDGVACFNHVYRQVTELVAQHLDDGSFEDGDFIEHLDVRFAELYFANVRAVQEGRRADRSWRPLFAARGDRTIWPLQFALAGMNAHINHDLALAVVTTCAERGTTPDTRPVHADYLRVNRLLAQIEARIRAQFEPFLLRVATRDAETLKHLVTSFSVARARDMAWGLVEALWPLRPAPLLYGQTAAVNGQAVGVIGRFILTPVVPLPVLEPVL